MRRVIKMPSNWRKYHRDQIKKRNIGEWRKCFSVMLFSGNHMNFICNKCKSKAEIKNWRHENSQVKFQIYCDDCSNTNEQSFIVDR